MANYFKLSEVKNGESIKFKLDKIGGLEKFSLWDNQTKKFIREGEWLETEKRKQEVNKFISLTEKEKERYTRNLKYSWDIVKGGEVVTTFLPVKVDKELVTLIDTIKTFDKDPMQSTFILTRAGEGLKTQWSIELDKSKDKMINGEPNEVEEKILSVLKTEPKYANYTNAERIKGMVAASGKKISEERATELITSNFPEEVDMTAL